MKKTETKYFDFGDENVQLYHNNCINAVGTIAGLSQIYNPWSDIVPGTARYQRVGDKITPRGMSLKLWIANKLDRPNVMYRILIVRVPKTVAGVATGNSFDPFQTVNQGSTGNKMLLPIDVDRGVKTLYDRVFNLQVGNSQIISGSLFGKECHVYKKLWIKRKKAGPIVFDGTGQYIVNNPIIIYVIPYDSYGTLTTDNIASLSLHCRLYYKDI